MENGQDIILQQENTLLRGRSLPALLDVPLHLNVDAVYDFKSDIDATDYKDEGKMLVKVVIEWKQWWLSLNFVGSGDKYCTSNS